MSEQNNSTDTKNKTDKLGTVLEFLETIVISVFIVIILFTFIFRIVLVEGASMVPTLKDGDRLVIAHLFYTPKQSDIVVVNSEGLDKTIIKRVIATENQTVYIDFEKHTITVDGKVLDEPYINDLTTRNDGGFEYPIIVPKNSIFVMGDNRNNSTDSRSPAVGFINEKDVLGRAIFRLMPFNSIGLLTNK